MTYEAAETGEATGRPVELYTFARDYLAWRYTSADRAVVAGGQSFAPRPISRSAIEATSEKARAAITITAPRDLPVADLFRVAPPTTGVTVLIQQYHEGDGELAALWTGRILGVSFEGMVARIQCEPVSTSMRRVGLRRVFQRQCPHVLYGPACGVNSTSRRIAATIDAVTPGTVLVPQADSLADGALAGGYLEWEVATGIMERRFIESHVGAVLTIVGSTYGLAASMEISLYPGCDHTMATCDAKFSNAPNYGGFPYWPQKNPFGGDPIF